MELPEQAGATWALCAIIMRLNIMIRVYHNEVSWNIIRLYRIYCMCTRTHITHTVLKSYKLSIPTLGFFLSRRFQKLLIVDGGCGARGEATITPGTAACIPCLILTSWSMLIPGMILIKLIWQSFTSTSARLTIVNFERVVETLEAAWIESCVTLFAGPLSLLLLLACDSRNWLDWVKAHLNVSKHRSSELWSLAWWLHGR